MPLVLNVPQPVRRKGHARDTSKVQVCLVPGIDVDFETLGHDFASESLNAANLILIYAKRVHPDQGRRGFRTRTRKVDRARRVHTGLVCGMIICSAERAQLPIIIVGRETEPGTS